MSLQSVLYAGKLGLEQRPESDPKPHQQSDNDHPAPNASRGKNARPKGA